CKEAERKIKETVECAMLGTMPRLMAMRAKDRVDPWVISKPRPAGAQQASCSISTRCKGGNLPRPTGPWGIKDGFDADLFVTSAELPDGNSCDLDFTRQLFYDGLRVSHG